MSDVSVVSVRVLKELTLSGVTPAGSTLRFPVVLSGLRFLIEGTGASPRTELTMEGLFTPQRDLWPGDKVRLEADVPIPFVATREAQSVRVLVEPVAQVEFKECFVGKVKDIQYDERGNILRILETQV